MSGDRRGEDGEMMGEELDLWHRDPLQCIEELLGNPAFENKFFTDEGCTNRLIDEAWTADWWRKAPFTPNRLFWLFLAHGHAFYNCQHLLSTVFSC